MPRRTDLYRSGNATNGTWSKVRVPKDIDVDPEGNVHPGDHGVSCFNKMQPSFQPRKTWILEKNTPIDPGLEAVLTGGAHYVMGPAEVMKLDEYVRRLATLDVPGRCRRADQPGEVEEEEDKVPQPGKFTHENKSVRFICDALSTVYHERIAIEEWDDNDYAYIGQLVIGLNAGEIKLGDVAWSGGNDTVKRASRFVADAVYAFIKDERKRKATDDDDAAAEMENDHGVLTASLGLDNPANPLFQELE